MRPTALAILLVAIATSAPGAEWRLASLETSADGRRATYVDLDSVREKGAVIQFESETYLDRENDGFNVVKELSEADCSSMSLTTVHAAYYRGKAPIAFVSVPTVGNYYASTSAQHWLLRRVCAHRFLSPAIPNLNNDATRLFASAWNPIPQSLTFAVPTIGSAATRDQLASR